MVNPWIFSAALLLGVLLSRSTSLALTIGPTTRKVKTQRVEIVVYLREAALASGLLATAASSRTKTTTIAAEVIAVGNQWAEGPLWVPAGSAEATRADPQHRGGFLLWSDVKANTVWRWSAGAHGGQPVVHLRPSGCYGDACDAAALIEPGANGLALDPQGRLVVCEHGNRRVVRLERDGTRTVLASAFNGRRLNSPNDLVLDHDGTFLYFTDPSYGLNAKEADPSREQQWNGVYRVRIPTNAGGATAERVELVTDTLTRPNGIAIVQHRVDAVTLIVANSNSTDRKWVTLNVPDALPAGGVDFRFPAPPPAVLRPGDAGGGDRRLDSPTVPGNPDGLKLDSAGRLWATGPEGVLIYSAAKATGAIKTPRALIARIVVGKKTGNIAFGPSADDGYHWLYICADDTVMRVKLGAPPPDDAHYVVDNDDDAHDEL